MKYSNNLIMCLPEEKKKLKNREFLSEIKDLEKIMKDSKRKKRKKKAIERKKNRKRPSRRRRKKRRT